MAEEDDEHGRDGNADTDTGKMQPGIERPAGKRQAFQDQGRGEDQDEGAGQSAGKAQEGKQEKRVDKRHRSRRRGAGRERGKEPTMRVAADERAGGQQRADQVTEEIGRGNQPGLPIWRGSAHPP